MKKFYFVNHWFECGGEPYTDLCIVYGISIEEFNKILKKQQEERLKDDEHGDGFYDILSDKVEKAGGKLECIQDEDLFTNR